MDNGQKFEFVQMAERLDRFFADVQPINTKINQIQKLTNDISIYDTDLKSDIFTNETQLTVS